MSRLRKLLLTASLLAAINCVSRSVHADEQPQKRVEQNTVIDHRLPNVLLLGDSISIGYTPLVVAGLDGRANVERPRANCGDTRAGLANIEKWLGDEKWQIIHFNWGLHDLCYRNSESKTQGHRDKIHGQLSVSLPDYEKNLETLVLRLKQTGATLIWASTTVVPEGEAGRFVGDDIKYNAAAERIMNKHGVQVNDLHATTKHFEPVLFTKPGDVHYTAKGYAKIADQVIAAITDALPRRTGTKASNPDIIGPWNLTELKAAPAMQWLSQTGPVHSLLYAGEKFRDRDTEVFAFYASPATLGQAKPDARFPAVVLIHGGGGTAFAEWTFLWAQRGYAAIAMDLSGSRPLDPVYDSQGIPVKNRAAKPETRTRLPNGGPNHGHPEKFDSIGGDISDDWPYHAVASVIRAHSLVRSFPEVLPDRTAVTGISWGGYTTCLVASLDDRFQAAVPVYGCGFLFEGESVQKPSIDKLGERREHWIEAYDPSSLLMRCRVPIFFVNGTNDVHYPLDSYQKSFDVIPGRKHMRIEVNMPHGHAAGWAPQEIGLFIDSYCRGGDSLPVPGKLVARDGQVVLHYSSAVPLKSAVLYYTSDTGLRSDRIWKSLPAAIEKDVVTAGKPPADANTWFIALMDQRNAMVTSPVQFQP